MNAMLEGVTVTGRDGKVTNLEQVEHGFRRLFFLGPSFNGMMYHIYNYNIII